MADYKPKILCGHNNNQRLEGGIDPGPVIVVFNPNTNLWEMHHDMAHLGMLCPTLVNSHPTEDGAYQQYLDYCLPKGSQRKYGCKKTSAKGYFLNAKGESITANSEEAILTLLNNIGWRDRLSDEATMLRMFSETLKEVGCLGDHIKLAPLTPTQGKPKNKGPKPLINANNPMSMKLLGLSCVNVEGQGPASLSKDCAYALWELEGGQAYRVVYYKEGDEPVLLGSSVTKKDPIASAKTHLRDKIVEAERAGAVRVIDCLRRHQLPLESGLEGKVWIDRYDVDNNLDVGLARTLGALEDKNNGLKIPCLMKVLQRRRNDLQLAEQAKIEQDNKGKSVLERLVSEARENLSPAAQMWKDFIYWAEEILEQQKGPEPMSIPNPAPENEIHVNDANARFREVTPAEQSILDKYAHELAEGQKRAEILQLEAINKAAEAELAQHKKELKKIKMSQRKKATLVQNVSLSAVATLILYLVMSKVFGRPIPDLRLQAPNKLRKGRKKRRPREDGRTDSGALALPAPSSPPYEEKVSAPRSRVRTRAK